MSERFQTDNRELDDLFERYRAAPTSHVFAPLADACRKAGMIEEALEICTRGVARHPRYASGHVVQGKCLYDSGRGNDAQAAFRRVLELDPKNLVALKYLGIIHAERGDMAGAREYFEHILAMDPGDREIRSRIEDVSQRPAIGRSTKVPPLSTPSPALATTVAIPIVLPASPVANAPAAPAPAVASAPEAGAGDDEAVLLPDVEDEAFQGEPITLRDETVTTDEIATITLADIYASQGYTTRALRIYREVLKRQPGNAALTAKIDALERQEAASRRAEKPAPPRAEPARRPPARPRPAEPAPPSPPEPGAIVGGNPIDQTRSYEHFKRWLKSSR